MISALDILLWISVALWAIFLIQGTINAVLIPDLPRLNIKEPSERPLVSYIVPARNEESGIRRAVESFCTQDYPNFEVIVVNDRSTDRTGDILAELRTQFSNLSVVEGKDPPAGWLGKPNALELGLRHAQGDWILMVDADAVHAPDVLRRAVAYGLIEGAGMVTIRPKHVSGSFLEAVLMSGVNFFFFVATPIFLVRCSKSAWFATGSPVFNLIRKDALEDCGGFGCLRQSVVDDVEIGFRVKKAGYRLTVAYSGESIEHRMYAGTSEVIRGFGKTTFPTIRNTPWLAPLYFALALVVSFLPSYGFAAGLIAGRWNIPAALALVLMHLVFAGFAWRYQEPWYVVLFNPLREAGWLWIFTRSLVLYYRQGIVWRGRSYPASTSPS